MRRGEPVLPQVLSSRSDLTEMQKRLKPVMSEGMLQCLVDPTGIQTIPRQNVIPFDVLQNRHRMAPKDLSERMILDLCCGFDERHGG